MRHNPMRPSCLTKFQVLSLLGQGFLAASLAGQTLPGRTLLWSDEFSQSDNSAPDASKWGYDLGGSGWGNNELQYYTNRTENVRIVNGELIIEARAENFGGRNFTSARLLTKDKWAWTYGRIEARIKVPKGQGIWPAFWMLGANIGSVSWPNCGEIDIMENIGSLPSTLYGTLHGPGYSGGNGISGNTILSGAALGDAYHVYAIEWEENRIRWFLDGKEFFALTPSDIPAGSSWVFRQPQFLLLNVAVGGNWPGPPNSSTTFPQRMSVDYVRVYAPTSATSNEAQVTVDPVEPWLGYMHVADLPSAGGSYHFGETWNTADLRASFTGSTVTLGPNSISDSSEYWYVGGGAPGKLGNKIMTANFYVEKTGSLAGKTLTFRGKVISNSLTQAHRTIAFIRDFSPDYSSFTTVTTPLSHGNFSIQLTTSANTGRHVQYGFETTGVNVWSTDTAPFGTIQIAPFSETSFSSWIASHDFSGFSNPDLSAAGDPDGDGVTNLSEFAFNGNPRDATASGKLRSRIETVVADETLVLTLPVRGAPVFTGNMNKSASFDGVSYTIEGTRNLLEFEELVIEVPASTHGLPPLDNGWTYRSFRLAGESIGKSPEGNRGFLRVRIAGTE
jgi:beta-glucanase (GH16 family)